jgi:hypothetical protein
LAYIKNYAHAKALTRKTPSDDLKSWNFECWNFRSSRARKDLGFWPLIQLIIELIGWAREAAFGFLSAASFWLEVGALLDVRKNFWAILPHISRPKMGHSYASPIASPLKARLWPTFSAKNTLVSRDPFFR